MRVEALHEGIVHDSMLLLADRMEPFFPHHAKSVRDELTVWTMDKTSGEWHGHPRNMTENRWNRLADIIGSLASLPGPFLSDRAKEVRFHALCQAEAARAMARHHFGGKRAYGAISLALYIVDPYIDQVLGPNAARPQAPEAP